MNEIAYCGTCLLIVLISVIFLILGKKDKRSSELIKKIPSSGYNVMKILMLTFKYIIKTGDTSQALFDMLHDISNKFTKQGICTLDLYPFADPVICILSPKFYRDILTDQSNLTKNSSYGLLSGMIGTRNLILSGGSEWKHDRKIINPSFKYSNLVSMNERIGERADMLIEWIKCSKNEIKDMQPYLATAITHVILESAVGKRIHPKNPRLLDYINSQKMFSNSMVIQLAIPIFYVFPSLFYNTIGLPIKLAVSRIKKFISDAVEDRIGELKSCREQENSCLSDSLIEAYLADPISVPKNVVIDNVASFVFAGHKATSYTMNAILFLLAANPVKQKELQKELDTNFSMDQIDEQILDHNMLNKCLYLTAVIKEGQRMYPISATIGRKVTKEFTCGGYTVPVNSEIVFDFNSLTKHPESFPYKPHEFIPERFLPGMEGYDEERDPYSTLPFSHGLRKCIGEKFALNILKVFLVKLLLQFNLETSLTMNDIKLVQDIMVYIRTPIDIRFVEKKN